jgi:serine/threonine protein kinase/tetratricopeptide (TPR) repeat protein
VNDERARRIEELYQRAVELDPSERQRFLDRHCPDEPSLRAEVETLLRNFDEADSKFLAEAPVRLGTPGRRLTDPEIIGPYRIHQRLGEGGFGLVYEAEQTQPFRRKVALKILKAGMDTDAVLARFEAERQALALMDHPNIARVFDAGATEQGRPYFVMELVRGESLSEYCDKHKLDVPQRLELFLPICHAIQHAHQKGVIHRDLKPTNILITIVDGRPVPKIIDFGIAKALSTPLTDRTLHTVHGQLVGTPTYMSPEQAERTGLDVDTTSDVYSLGVVLYQLLCGKLPFDSYDLGRLGPEQFARMIREIEPPPPSAHLSEVDEDIVEIARRRRTDPWRLAHALRGELDWIVQRAMEKDRTRRYQTAHDLALEIQRHLRDEPVEASPPSAAYRFRKFVRRHRVGIGLAGVIVLAVIAAGAALSYALLESNEQRAQARAAQQESEVVTRFLSDMLSAATPGLMGREVSLREVMDWAGPRIEQEFGGKSPIEAALHLTLGAAYRELGEHDAARAHLERGYELRLSTLGPRDLATLDALRELGQLQHYEGNYDLAESTFTTVLRERRAQVGDDARPTLAALHDFATIRLRQERDAEVVALLEDGLRRATVALGGRDDLTRRIANDLAIVYQGTGRYEEAEDLYVESLRIDEERFGRYHPDTLASQQNLGSLYRELGRFEEALPLYLASNRGAIKSFGEEHPTSLRYLSNLALLYSDMERFEEAEPLSRRALELREELLGEENPTTIVSGINLALLYLRMGRWEECRRLAERMRDISRKTVGEDHLYTLAVESTLGNAYLGLGEAERAELLLRSVTDGFRRTQSEGHWRTGLSLVRHGTALTALGRYTEAESRLIDGHQILSEVVGDDDKRTREAVTGLVELYERSGQTELRERWARKLAPEATP